MAFSAAARRSSVAGSALRALRERRTRGEHRQQPVGEPVDRAPARRRQHPVTGADPQRRGEQAAGVGRRLSATVEPASAGAEPGAASPGVKSSPCSRTWARSGRPGGDPGMRLRVERKRHHPACGPLAARARSTRPASHGPTSQPWLASHLRPAGHGQQHGRRLPVRGAAAGHRSTSSTSRTRHAGGSRPSRPSSPWSWRTARRARRWRRRSR